MVHHALQPYRFGPPVELVQVLTNARILAGAVEQASAVLQTFFESLLAGRAYRPEELRAFMAGNASMRASADEFGRLVDETLSRFTPPAGTA